MDNYIEFVKIHLPDIIAFALIVVAYLRQFLFAVKGRKTNLLTKTFFNEKVKLVDDAFVEMKATAAEFRKGMEELRAENERLRKRLKKAERAILAMCGQREGEKGTADEGEAQKIVELA